MCVLPCINYIDYIDYNLKCQKSRENVFNLF